MGLDIENHRCITEKNGTEVQRSHVVLKRGFIIKESAVKWFKT